MSVSDDVQQVLGVGRGDVEGVYDVKVRLETEDSLCLGDSSKGGLHQFHTNSVPGSCGATRTS